MGFKADTSFLRFVSMGAVGTHRTIAQLREMGFEPIELERYSGSNKIWATKVKRLRLPDILCIKTGLRVEARGKSKLEIRMSDAPTNPDRRWNTGLRNIDLVALIACREQNGKSVPADKAVFFTVGDLQRTEGTSKLGQPKSAGEGAERDRTWPATVPKGNGVVEEVTAERIRVRIEGEDGGKARGQSYKLEGKIPYVHPGDRFVGNASIIAGTPPRQADLGAYLKNRYEPLNELLAENPVDRYAAVKALRFRHDLKAQAIPALENHLGREVDDRVLLETAGSGAALGSAKASERVQTFIWDHERGDLRMEAVLILIELKNDLTRKVLRTVATDKRFANDEIRQAAVWGLGKAGACAYGDLFDFIDDDDRDVALHAIAAFGRDTPARIIDRLITELIAPNAGRPAAASEALRLIGTNVVLERLIAAIRDGNDPDAWILATLGRLPADRVRKALAGDPLLARLEPLLLLGPGTNWLADDTVDIDLKFLLKQDL
ncbi:MAG TPA: hypothetical protein VGG11_18900 [Xanthobacteraceae bacterium]|jgi:hypothetical protein